MEKGSYFPKKLWKVFNICGEILAGKSMAWAKISICSAVSENLITSHKAYVNEGGIWDLSWKHIPCVLLPAQIFIHTMNEELGCICSQHHLTVVTRTFHFFSKDRHPRACCHNLLTSFGTSMLGTKTRKGTETMKFLRRNLNSV